MIRLINVFDTEYMFKTVQIAALEDMQAVRASLPLTVAAKLKSVEYLPSSECYAFKLKKDERFTSEEERALEDWMNRHGITQLMRCSATRYIFKVLDRIPQLEAMLFYASGLPGCLLAKIRRLFYAQSKYVLELHDGETLYSDEETAIEQWLISQISAHGGVR